MFALFDDRNVPFVLLGKNTVSYSGFTFIYFSDFKMIFFKVSI